MTILSLHRNSFSRSQIISEVITIHHKNVFEYQIVALELCKLLILDPVHFYFVVNELIDVGNNGGALNVHQDEAGDNLGLQGRVGPGGGPGIDIELVLVFVGFKLVGVAGYQDVAVQLSEYVSLN